MLTRAQSEHSIIQQASTEPQVLSNTQLYLAQLNHVALGRLEKINTLGDHVRFLAAALSPSLASIPKRSLATDESWSQLKERNPPAEEENSKGAEVPDMAEFVRLKLEHLRSSINHQRDQVLRMEANIALQRFEDSSSMLPVSMPAAEEKTW